MRDRVETQLDRIQNSVATRRCARCNSDLNVTGIVGTGSFNDGLFCSLDCYTRFVVTNEENLPNSANIDVHSHQSVTAC